jgi:hypothetical protein
VCKVYNSTNENFGRANIARCVGSHLDYCMSFWSVLGWVTTKEDNLYVGHQAVFQPSKNYSRVNLIADTEVTPRIYQFIVSLELFLNGTVIERTYVGHLRWWYSNRRHSQIAR